ncbi:phage tail sheath subtilisin-like domain-containing protein [Desulfovibrio sp. OttesenSCG-928-C06]|nr:phage tail sheath subtilisin-like domain-containing protein [Desulfovibrio sp. OttesenSCG-928-C06]
MSQIVFPSLPDTVLLPFTYTEFDGTGASEDLSLNPFITLIPAQMLPTGSAEPLVPVRPTSVSIANAMFGRGSQAARMCEKYLNANPVTKMLVIPVLDDETAVAATGTVHFAGHVSTATPVCLYIGGQLARFGVSSSTTASAIAIGLRDVINALPDMRVIASTEDATLVLTAKNKGECGNDLDLRFGYQGEAFPDGVTAVITPMAGGAGNPDAAEVVTSMGNDRYHMIAWPWRDQASLVEIKAEMDSRWGPLRQIDGQLITVTPGNFVEAVTFSSAHNNKHLSVLASEGTPTPCDEDAAASMAILAYYGNQQPSRGFNTLVIPGVSAPRKYDMFTDFPEKNQGLMEGLSTRYVDPDGNVCFSKVITTQRLNSLGAEDKAFLSLNSPLTLSYLRYDWNNYLKLKYPRHMLASDGDEKLRSPDVPVMTPKQGKAEAVARMNAWIAASLIEGAAQFEKDLRVARNARNENRLDWFMRPNLMNQFEVAGTVMRHLV